MMKIELPDTSGRKAKYRLTGTPLTAEPLPDNPVRTVLAAVHVVVDPFAPNDPTGPAKIDWKATMNFRRHVAGLGLGIAEAMDTAQRGMGLDWQGALELMVRTRQELPDALVFNGCGTDHLHATDSTPIDKVVSAYLEQLEAIQKIGGRIIIMASRALAGAAQSPADYKSVYGSVLRHCDQPVILHWLGDMFDPALAGYWGADEFSDALETVLEIIEDSKDRIDGIKVSLLDKDREVAMRRRLPDGVRMYTGDDFNYPELIAGDEEGQSDALLGIFDPLAPAAAAAIARLGAGDRDGFHAILDPTVPLARLIFRPPTQHYKSGIVFLAWLNGFQDHFIMLGGAQSMRPLPYYVQVFRLADRCGLLRDPDLAVHRMRQFLSLYGS